MLLDARIRGIPLTFLIVLVFMILLTIFFGAWAVSADVGRQSGSFAFGAAGTGPSFVSVNSESSSEETINSVLGAQDGGRNAADEWWSDALLKACPFH